jgi:hypothetical protein
MFYVNINLSLIINFYLHKRFMIINFMIYVIINLSKKRPLWPARAQAEMGRKWAGIGHCIET